MAFEGEDAEMLVPGADGDDADGDDFFAEALGPSGVDSGIEVSVPAGSGCISDDSDSDGDGGLRGGVDEGARQTEEASDGLPKVTLDGCKASAETTPSLAKNLTVSGQLFQQKRDVWIGAKSRTMAAQKLAGECGADEKQLGLFQSLLEGIEATRLVCDQATLLIAETLAAVDGKLLELHPVSGEPNTGDFLCRSHVRTTEYFVPNLLRVECQHRFFMRRLCVVFFCKFR